MSTDYRLSHNRGELFTRLYQLNLHYGIMPGLVYMYMPMLADRYNWDGEQRLWFAFLNGLTQNPITSLRMFRKMPEPTDGFGLDNFSDWFNENWDNLQFDTDRRYQKKLTCNAIADYVHMIGEYGSQTNIYPKGLPYADVFKRISSITGFGRLSAFSGSEYIYIMNFGSDCDDLMLKDKSGSKSHRNGALLLNGFDELVWDKRMPNSHDGTYPNFKEMCAWLEGKCDSFLSWYKTAYQHKPVATFYAGHFTLESNLCTFKNHFFDRRYPGVYADMAFERILWAEERGVDRDITDLFREMYATLPVGLQYGDDPLKSSQRGRGFKETGRPYRVDALEELTEYNV